MNNSMKGWRDCSLAALIREKYDRLMPAHAEMFLLIFSRAFAVLTEKTILPRGMFVFHMLMRQIGFVLIPDIRQLAEAEVSTMDFVLSQGSGGAALLIWVAASAIWTGANQTEMERTDHVPVTGGRETYLECARSVPPCYTAFVWNNAYLDMYRSGKK